MGDARRPRKIAAWGASAFIRGSPALASSPAALEAVPMPIAVLIIPLLAAAAQTAAPPEPPVVVTGHAWAPFISPMGEPFRAHSPTDDTLANWFNQADLNHDGWLTAAEMQADSARFFAKLDSNQDGKLDPDELIHYEWDVAPDIQVNSRQRRLPAEAAASPASEHWQASDMDRSDDPGGRKSRRHKDEGGLQGAARYALLNIPEPVASADLNFDRDISLAEFSQAAAARFQLLDPGHSGALSLAQLRQVQAKAMAANLHHKHRDDDRDQRIAIPLPPGD